jgi:hypothetical protein
MNATADSADVENASPLWVSVERKAYDAEGSRGAFGVREKYSRKVQQPERP